MYAKDLANRTVNGTVAAPRDASLSYRTMATDYFDKLAEASVKDAIQQLAAAGKRPTIRTVPAEAGRLVQKKARGRLTELDSQKRVQKAIDRLKERKEIKAPNGTTSEWALIGAEAPPAEQS